MSFCLCEKIDKFFYKKYFLYILKPTYGDLRILEVVFYVIYIFYVQCNY